MKENAVAQEKKTVISMLYKLLEKVKHHDSIVDKRNKKLAEIDQQQKKIDIPRKKIKAVWKVLGCILVVIGWIILLVVFLVRKSKYKKLQAVLAAEMQALQVELAKINEELETYDARSLIPYINSIVPDKFPRRYCMNALSIEGMTSLLIDLRADTLKEAMNLYEECMHRARIEALIGANDAHLIAAATANNLRLEHFKPELFESESDEAAAEVVEETAEVVEETAEVVEETAEVVEETAEVVEETAEVAEETAEVSEETAEVAEETAEVSEETAEIAEETAEVAEETVEVVEETPVEEAATETEPEQKAE